jgi:apolipoprotein N-acyltransferase
MKNTWKWIIGIVLVLVVLFALPFVWRLAGYGTYEAFGGRGGFGGMPMHNFGFGMMPFGMLFMGVIPLGVVALVVLGIVWLARNWNAARPPARTCASCGKPAQADWTTCPYCGKKL